MLARGHLAYLTNVLILVCEQNSGRTPYWDFKKFHLRLPPLIEF